MMKIILASLVLFSSIHLYGQTTEDDDPAVVGELGGAMNWNVKGFAANGGPTVAIEITPVKEWLELEFGATRSYSRGVSESSFDLLFKKPYTFSRRFEFMVGAGPEFSSVKTNDVTTNDWGVELALDLMYWPFKKKRFGFYIEPGYDLSFGAGNEQDVGFNGGLLIGFK